MTRPAKAYQFMTPEEFAGYIKRNYDIIAQITGEIARETDPISLEVLKDERSEYRRRIIEAYEG